MPLHEAQATRSGQAADTRDTLSFSLWGSGGHTAVGSLAVHVSSDHLIKVASARFLRCKGFWFGVIGNSLGETCVEAV